jgi:hypothetical protein
MNKTWVGLAMLISAILTAPLSAAILITGNEVWDGVSNPRAGEGVTLSGGVYTIPTELVIGSGAKLSLNSSRFEVGATPTSSLTFNFTAGAGGLTFADATSTFDIHTGDRFGPVRTLTLNMLDNPISGPGRIVNGPVLVSETGNSMFLTINSQADVSLAQISTAKKDAQLAHIDITTSGAVNIGSLSTSDVVDGGASAGWVFVKAKSITLGGIDAVTSRLDGNGDNGSIFLTALNPPSFDVNNLAGNDAAENIIALTGAVTTNGPATVGPNVGGNITMRAVKYVLGSGFSLDKGENGVVSIAAGTLDNGFTAGDLFMNQSSAQLTPAFTVLHVPEPATVVVMLLGAGLVPLIRRRSA